MTESEWLTSDDPAKMLQFVGSPYSPGVSGTGADGKPYTFRVSDRRLRLFAYACVRQLWDRLTDSQREKVIFAEQEPWDEATLGSVHAAYLSQFAITQYTDRVSDDHCIIYALGWLGAQNAREVASQAPAWLQRLVLFQTQAALLRDIVGNPFRRVNYDPLWGIRNQGCVILVANAAYTHRLPDGMLDPARLAVLSDALEEAGCDSEPLLRHLRGWRPCYYCWDNPAIDREANEWCTYCGYERWLNGDFGPGPHVRGCWALDLILGKE